MPTFLSIKIFLSTDSISPTQNVQHNKITHWSLSRISPLSEVSLRTRHPSYEIKPKHRHYPDPYLYESVHLFINLHDPIFRILDTLDRLNIDISSFTSYKILFLSM